MNNLIMSNFILFIFSLFFLNGCVHNQSTETPYYLKGIIVDVNSSKPLSNVYAKLTELRQICPLCKGEYVEVASATSNDNGRIQFIIYKAGEYAVATYSSPESKIENTFRLLKIDSLSNAEYVFELKHDPNYK